MTHAGMRAFRGKAMSRLPAPILLVAFAASPGFAQTPQIRQASVDLGAKPASTAPGSVPAQLPPAFIDNLIRFNTESIEVKQNGPRWQIWDGKTLVRDFGDKREHAFEARQLIADLKLTERAVIGTPQPVMEYWLSSGEAPHPPTLARRVIPFDPGTLKVERFNGEFVVRDHRHILYNFGPYQNDAIQALAVMQKYQFNELGVIGDPRPSMTYLIFNERPHMSLNPNDPNSKLKLLPQQAPRHALILPKLGTVGERTPFDPLRTDIHKESDGWHLVAGPHDLARLGNSDYHARQAVLAVQRYPLNEYVRVGTA